MLALNRPSVRPSSRKMFLFFLAAALGSAEAKVYTDYLPITAATLTLMVKEISIVRYTEGNGTTELETKIKTSRFGNRQVLELLAAAGLLLGEDGEPTDDISGWALVAGTGFNQTPWPRLEGIGFYAVNMKILKIEEWDGSTLYVPGLSLFGGLNGTPAEPTLAKIQIGGDVPFTAADLVAEASGETTLVNGEADFEGPAQIDIVLPDPEAPTESQKAIGVSLQGHIKGGFRGFNWHPDEEKQEPQKNTLPLKRTTISGISGILPSPPAEENGVSVPSVVTGAISLRPTRLIPYSYQP
jgi:hypothetical protein